METTTEQSARIAERKRVDAFYSKGKRGSRPAAPQLTPEEIAAQKAALLRQQITNQYAPSGFQALLNVLGFGGQTPQPPRR